MAGGRLVWESDSPLATLAAGEALGTLLLPGDLVALSGELGSGKTVLVRGLAAGLGCRADEVHSPSFTLVNEYACRRGGESAPSCRLAHVDLYRIASEAEVPGIGWDEYLAGRFVVAVEWAERAGSLLPGDRLQVALESVSQERRRLSCEGTGRRSAALVQHWWEAVRRRPVP